MVEGRAGILGLNYAYALPRFWYIVRRLRREAEPEWNGGYHGRNVGDCGSRGNEHDKVKSGCSYTDWVANFVTWYIAFLLLSFSFVRWPVE